MTISVEYDKKRNRVIVESDEPGSNVDHRRILGDGPTMAVIKHYTEGKVEAMDDFNLIRKLNEIYRQKTGAHADNIIP